MNRYRWYLTLLVAVMIHTAVNAQVIEPGKTGETLIAALRANFTPQTTLSYRNAREHMFTDFDNHNGQVRLVYSGQHFATTAIPNHTVVNTEHTWPQSKFRQLPGSDRAALKADLHHLFPVFSKINSARGNSPFAEIDDTQTSKWWADSDAQTVIPTDSIEDFSESTTTRFEPREDHKGNVARALAYVFTVYGHLPLDSDWFRPQIETLFHWHQADPADATERARTEAIAALQGTANPYVLDASLFQRALMSSDGATVPDPDVEPDDTALRQQLLDRIERIETELQGLKDLIETGDF